MWIFDAWRDRAGANRDISRDSMAMFQHVFLAAEQLNIVDLIKDSTGAVMAVLVILVAMSLVSWYIIAMKESYLRKARRQSDKFPEVFGHSKRLDNTYKEAEQLVRSPVAQMFRAGYVELTKLKKGEKERDKDAETMELSGIENVERALRRASLAETTELEKNLSFLAVLRRHLSGFSARCGASCTPLSICRLRHPTWESKRFRDPSPKPSSQLLSGFWRLFQASWLTTSLTKRSKSSKPIWRVSRTIFSTSSSGISSNDHVAIIARFSSIYEKWRTWSLRGFKAQGNRDWGRIVVGKYRSTVVGKYR